MPIAVGPGLRVLFSCALLAVTVSFLYRLRHPEWVEFQRGEREFLAGNFSDAIPHYTDALKMGLRDQRVFFHLGDSYLATERFRDAVLVYEQMLENLPPHPKALQNLARLYDQLSGADRAIELYKRYDGKLTLDVEGSLHLAGLYKRRGEFELALPLYTRVVDFDPNFASAKLEFAEMLAWMKRFSHSTKLYESVIRDYPEDRLALTHYARTLVWSGDPTAAAPIYIRALTAPLGAKNSPGLVAFGKKVRDSTIRWELARAFGQAKKFDASVRTYRELISGEPTLYEAVVELATVLTWQDKREEAFAVLNTLPPDAAKDKVLVFLADHYSAQKDFARAEQLYNEYLAKFPNDSEVRLKYADMLAWKKDHKTARENYNQILDNNPPTWIARTVDERTILLLADYHVQKSEFVEAKSFFDLYLGMYPEDLIARSAYAQALVRSGDYDQAVRNFDIVLAKQSNQPEIELLKAEALGLGKHYHDSIFLYRELAKDDLTKEKAAKGLAKVLFWKGELDEPLSILMTFPMDQLEPDLLLVLAEIYTSKKNFSSAEGAYEKYLSKKPDDDKARFKYAEMLSWSKRIPDSLREFEVLVAKLPEDIELRRKYALILTWAGRNTEAVKEFDIAAQLQKKLSPTPVPTGGPKR